MQQAGKLSRKRRRSAVQLRQVSHKCVICTENGPHCQSPCRQLGALHSPLAAARGALLSAEAMLRLQRHRTCLRPRTGNPAPAVPPLQHALVCTCSACMLICPWSSESDAECSPAQEMLQTHRVNESTKVQSCSAQRGES